MIIVTGAAGFIGSNMIAELASAGNQSIVACDYWGSGKKWMNVSKHFIADFVHPDELLQYIRQEKRIHAVLHLGAISATSELNVDNLIKTNIRLTIDLWDLCTELNIVFFYASSAATYGSLEADLVDDQSPEALAKLRPLNGYGWSKHSVDQILMQRVSTLGMSSHQRTRIQQTRRT